MSRSIRSLRLIEISLNDHYPVADVMMDGLGFARDLDFEPFIALEGIIPMIWRGPIELIAERPRRHARRDPGPARPCS